VLPSVGAAAHLNQQRLQLGGPRGRQRLRPERREQTQPTNGLPRRVSRDPTRAPRLQLPWQSTPQGPAIAPCREHLHRQHARSRPRPGLTNRSRSQIRRAQPTAAAAHLEASRAECRRCHGPRRPRDWQGPQGGPRAAHTPRTRLAFAMRWCALREPGGAPGLWRSRSGQRDGLRSS